MSTHPGQREEIKRWKEMLTSERDAAALYDRLAAAETGERSTILSELAEVERRHASHWESKLASAGVDVQPGQPRVSLRTRMLGLLARVWSTAAVLPMVERTERADAHRYDNDPDAAATMASEERGHAKTLSRLMSSDPPEQASAQELIAKKEHWHRGDRSGSLRAAIFGVSDGLVSNTALVMGFAGSGASRSTILLAGVSGLLAGAFSMAAGEYVSMASQREMYQRELEIEARELAETPDEEREELILLYRAKGLDPDQAERVADKIMSDSAVALDTLAREELGLDPDALGSPWSAAASSLAAFAAGAFVVVGPYLVAGGLTALIAAIVVAVAAMAVVGAGVGLLNGRSPLRGAARQIIAGGLAALVTYGVGFLLGVSVI